MNPEDGRMLSERLKAAADLLEGCELLFPAFQRKTGETPAEFIRRRFMEHDFGVEEAQNALRTGALALDAASEVSRKTLGGADWIYDEQWKFHIPCCRMLVPQVGHRGAIWYKRCGNGPLTGDGAISGSCGEHGGKV